MNKKNVTQEITATPRAGSSINDILFLAHAYEDKGEVNDARILYDRASTSYHGMIEYARFLLSASPLDNLSKQERMTKAENLLTYVERNEAENEAGYACMMLANFYKHAKEIRLLGFMMRANRYGKNEDAALQAQLLKKSPRWKSTM